MPQDRYVLAAVSVNGTVIGGISGQALDTRINQAILSADGQVDPTFACIMGAVPVFSFRTYSLDAILAILTINGLAISANVVLYLQKTQNNGIRATGSVHRTITIANGMIIPRSMGASQGAPAMFAFDVIATSSNGENSPLAFANNVALPTLPGVTQLFTVGPFYRNGAANVGVQSIQCDFGLQEEMRDGDGNTYPKGMHIASRQPRIEIGFDDAAVGAGLGLFEAQGATDSYFFFRAKTRLGASEADGNASHIKVGVDDGIWLHKNTGGDHPNFQSSVIECMPVFDGTNPIIAVTTGQVIS